MLISSRDTLPDTPRSNASPDIWAPCGPVTSPHTMNPHYPQRWSWPFPPCSAFPWGSLQTQPMFSWGSFPQALVFNNARGHYADSTWSPRGDRGPREVKADLGCQQLKQRSERHTNPHQNESSFFLWFGVSLSLSLCQGWSIKDVAQWANLCLQHICNCFVHYSGLFG